MHSFSKFFFTNDSQKCLRKKLSNGTHEKDYLIKRKFICTKEKYSLALKQ